MATTDDTRSPGTCTPPETEEIEILEIVGLDEDTASPPPGDRPDDGAARKPSGEPEAAIVEERLRRIQADFENLKKRVARDEEAERRLATSRLVSRLLGVLDNFERAIATGKQDTTVSGSFQAGVEMIYRQLVEELRREGLRPVEALGRCFDPNEHHAVATDQTSDQPMGTVVEEFQRGYYLHERLLRPALVKVRVESEAGENSGEPRQET